MAFKTLDLPTPDGPARTDIPELFYAGIIRRADRDYVKSRFFVYSAYFPVFLIGVYINLVYAYNYSQLLLFGKDYEPVHNIRVKIRTDRSKYNNGLIYV